jgi:hypothetical protein
MRFPLKTPVLPSFHRRPVIARARRPDCAAIMRRRNGPRGTCVEPDALQAEDLAHLFCGLSLRRFRGFALSGGFGEAIGAGTRQSLLGEPMLFSLVLR